MGSYSKDILLVNSPPGTAPLFHHEWGKAVGAWSCCCYHRLNVLLMVRGAGLAVGDLVFYSRIGPVTNGPTVSPISEFRWFIDDQYRRIRQVQNNLV
jgi:hypothetical protein